MKKLFALLITCAIVCLLTLSIVASAIPPTKSVVLDTPYQSTEEGVCYSVNSVTLTDAPSLARLGDSGRDIAFEISIGSSSEFELAVAPKLASDEKFSEIIDIENIEITTDIDTGSTMLHFEAHASSTLETIYVRMPIISRVTEDKILEENVSFDNVVHHSEIINGKQVDMFTLSFDKDEFSKIPRKLALGKNEEVKSLLSNIYLDDNGNILSGYFVFVKPSDFEPSNTYDVIINGTFENCEPVVAAISLK